jgi:hypothetical protein
MLVTGSATSSSSGRVVGDTVDERGVSAVFQQATHQIRQQRFVGADRRVHAAWTVQFAFGNFAYNLLVQRFAHAVQALELVLARVVVVARDDDRSRDRVWALWVANCG